MKSAKTVFRVIVPVVLSATVCGALFFNFASEGWLSDLLRRLSVMPLRLVAAAFAFMAANILVAAWRYQVVMRDLVVSGRAVRFSTIVALNWFSLFVSYILPLPFLADATRAGYLRGVLRLPARTAVESVVFDRVAALVGLVIFGLAGLPIQAQYGVSAASLRLQGAIWGAALAMGLTLALVYRNPGKAPRALRALVDSLQSFGRLYATPGRFLLQLAISAAYVASFAGTVLAVGHGIGASLDLPIVLACTAVIFLAQNIPIFWGGWGGREAAVIATLGSIKGIGIERGLAISILVGTISMLVSLPGGILLLIHRPGSS